MKYLKGHAKKAPALPERGFIMYQGPSMLDGAPIVVIATMSTSNVKTGQMVQTWILRADINPSRPAKPATIPAFAAIVFIGTITRALAM